MENGGFPWFFPWFYYDFPMENGGFLVSYGFPMVFRWFSVVQEDPRGQVHGPEGQADQGAQDGGRILPFLEADQWPFIWKMEYLYGIFRESLDDIFI